MDPIMDKFQRALAADRDTVLQFLSDNPPHTEPVFDYVTDLEERCALFAEMKQLYWERCSRNPNAAVLAIFMVAPVSEIRKRVAVMRTAPEHENSAFQALTFQAPCEICACMFCSLRLLQ